MGRNVLGLLALGFTLSIAVPSPDAIADLERRLRAVARAHPTGNDAVYVGQRVGSRRLVWRAPSRHERIITNVTWSKRRDALAFATLNRRGGIKLVVVLVGGDLDGHTMTWPIPPHARESSRPTVTWLGRRRVAFGRSELRPDVVASWSVRK